MSERVAIVSRGFDDLERVRAYVRSLPRDTVIVSGGACGVDSAAEHEARIQKMPDPVVLYPDWERWGKAAGPIRNRAIVEAADRLVAFWDERSPGTKNAVEQDRGRGIPVLVFTEAPEPARG